MKTLFTTLLIIALAISCTPYRYLDKHHAEICNKCIDEYTSNIDTTDKIIIKHDTAYIDVSENIHDTTLVYLKCDSLGNVVIVTTKKLGNANRIISSYILKNNVLSVINEQLNSKVMILQDSIIILKKAIQIIDKPAITVYKTPIWVYICGGFLLLFLIILLILVFKK